jgi:hypothetical protein
MRVSRGIESKKIVKILKFWLTITDSYISMERIVRKNVKRDINRIGIDITYVLRAMKRL